MVTDRIIRRKEVLTMLGYSSATLHRRIKDGTVPAPLLIGPNSVGWRESSIQAVLNAFEPVTADNIVQVAPGSKRGRKPSQTREG